jgi:anaerobic C4-dicarboxylate transporter
MRARIGIALGLYWGGIVYVIDVIAAISALGAIGGLSALLSAFTKYMRLHSHTATTSARHALCNKG